MELPSKPFEKAVQELAKLPGIGRRSALRMALHLLKKSPESTLQLAESLRGLAQDVQMCGTCHSLSDAPICSICSNTRRDHRVVCVVEDLRDVLALENTGTYKGVYHVLGGLISPMDGVGPSDLTIDRLIERAQGVQEIIFALSATTEGDTTAFYLYKKLADSQAILTAIARGLPVGDSLEYVDEVTLSRSLAQRLPFEQTLSR